MYIEVVTEHGEEYTSDPVEVTKEQAIMNQERMTRMTELLEHFKTLNYFMIVEDGCKRYFNPSKVESILLVVED